MVNIETNGCETAGRTLLAYAQVHSPNTQCRGIEQTEETRMTQRSALMIAVGITAFVLVFAGALATYVTQAKPQAANATEQPVASAAAPDADQQAQPAPVQTMRAVLNAREAASQQQLAEANRRIEEANGRLKQLYDRFGTPIPTPTETPQAAQPEQPAQQPVQFAEATPTAAAPEPEQPEPSITISPRDAALAALRIASGATLTQVPRIVSYGSTAAYEVVLDRGNVYVDAANGQVLYNGATADPAAPAQPSYSDDNQESGEDD